MFSSPERTCRGSRCTRRWRRAFLRPSAYWPWSQKWILRQNPPSACRTRVMGGDTPDTQSASPRGPRGSDASTSECVSTNTPYETNVYTTWRTNRPRTRRVRDTDDNTGSRSPSFETVLAKKFQWEWLGATRVFCTSSVRSCTYSRGERNTPQTIWPSFCTPCRSESPSIPGCSSQSGRGKTRGVVRRYRTIRWEWRIEPTRACRGPCGRRWWHAEQLCVIVKKPSFGINGFVLFHNLVMMVFKCVKKWTVINSPDTQLENSLISKYNIVNNKIIYIVLHAFIPTFCTMYTSIP